MVVRGLAGRKLWEDIQIRRQHVLVEQKKLKGLGYIGDRNSLSIATTDGGLRTQPACEEA